MEIDINKKLCRGKNRAFDNSSCCRPVFPCLPKESYRLTHDNCVTIAYTCMLTYGQWTRIHTMLRIWNIMRTLKYGIGVSNTPKYHCSLIYVLNSYKWMLFCFKGMTLHFHDKKEKTKTNTSQILYPIAVSTLMCLLNLQYLHSINNLRDILFWVHRLIRVWNVKIKCDENLKKEKKKK